MVNYTSIAEKLEKEHSKESKSTVSKTHSKKPKDKAKEKEGGREKSDLSEKKKERKPSSHSHHEKGEKPKRENREGNSIMSQFEAWAADRTYEDGESVFDGLNGLNESHANEGLCLLSFSLPSLLVFLFPLVVREYFNSERSEVKLKDLLEEMRSDLNYQRDEALFPDSKAKAVTEFEAIQSTVSPLERFFESASLTIRFVGIIASGTELTAKADEVLSKFFGNFGLFRLLGTILLITKLPETHFYCFRRIWVLYVG